MPPSTANIYDHNNAVRPKIAASSLDFKTAPQKLRSNPKPGIFNQYHQ